MQTTTLAGVQLSGYIGKILAKDLFSFCVDLFSKVGVPRKDAEVVSEHLVLANLRGVDSHGALVRVPRYLPDIQSGQINLSPNVKLVKETVSTGLMDGDNGLGQVVAMKATELAIEKAETTGVGIVGAKNISHAGMLARYTLKVVERGLFGLACTNAPPFVVPWGGARPIFGANPICIGFPLEKEKSIVLDMATSSVSAGKIVVMAAKGEKMPEGWALDKHGKPTTDPKAFLDGGMLLPFGGYKGYGLSLSVEAIAGVLIGAPFSIHIRPGWATQGGFIVEALKIDAFRPYEEYTKDMLEFESLIESCPLAEGSKEILLPGVLENREYERRSKDGIPVDEESWKALKKVSDDLVIRLPDLIH
jgi:LDH2 family malate/lactate/ureidoglycolate dehydrogenase